MRELELLELEVLELEVFKLEVLQLEVLELEVLAHFQVTVHGSRFTCTPTCNCNCWLTHVTDCTTYHLLPLYLSISISIPISV